MKSVRNFITTTEYSIGLINETYKDYRDGEALTQDYLSVVKEQLEAAAHNSQSALDTVNEALKMIEDDQNNEGDYENIGMSYGELVAIDEETAAYTV